MISAYKWSLTYDWVGLASDSMLLFTLIGTFIYTTQIHGMKTPERLMVISNSGDTSNRYVQAVYKNIFAWVLGIGIFIADLLSIIVWIG
jgi:hypothetical protein